jgi:hypothetical protein
LHFEQLFFLVFRALDFTGKVEAASIMTSQNALISRGATDPADVEGRGIDFDVRNIDG